MPNSYKHSVDKSNEKINEKGQDATLDTPVLDMPVLDMLSFVCPVLSCVAVNPPKEKEHGDAVTALNT